MHHPAPAPPSAPALGRRVAAGLLLTAVGLAFADTSVVALALPDIGGEYDASIPAVSGVLAVYALAVAAVGLAALGPLRRVDPAVMTATGAALFAAASVLAGRSPTLEVLYVARAIQGAGGAALAIGALAVLGRLGGGLAGATRRWAAAGSIGAVVGPALGGFVTQFADWRAVFLIQAPVALGALVAAVITTNAALPSVTQPTRPDRRRGPGALTADLALAAVYASLVGALFLGVILVVTVWGIDPALGAVLVSALPVGTLAASRLPFGPRSAPATMAGGVLLAGGLTTLAWVPGVAPVWALLGFGLCGLGFGLLSSQLGPIAVAAHDGGRAASLSSTARHLGLVAGLVVIAPVLAGNVEAAAARAPIPATSTLLDAPLDSGTKIGLALDIRDGLAAAVDHEIPDLDPVFAPYVDRDPAVAEVRDDLEEAVRTVLTRSFRTAFVVSALLALAAGLTGAVATTRGATDSPRRSLLTTGAVAAAVGISVALPSAAYAAGGDEAGAVEPADPCTAAPDPFPGSGFDAAAQRLVFSGLNGAACELGTSREELVLSLEPRSGVDDVTWDRPTIERALRSGVDRALEDADSRDSLPGWLAWSLQSTVRHAPISWFLDRLGVG